MIYFVWTPDLDTGIDIIDSQHRRIVDYINQTYDAIDMKNGAVIQTVVNNMVEYTISHFSFEESLMERAKYHLLTDHKAVHKNFTDRIASYQERLERGEDPIIVGRRFLSDLQIWLTNHIKKEDADYVKVVRKALEPGWVSRMLAVFFK